MELNWYAHIVAALVPLVIGFIYYHPKVAGTAWMQATGITPEMAKKSNMAVTFGVSLVMAFLATMPVAIAVNHDVENFATFKHGALHGSLLGLLLVMPVIVTNGLFEQRSFKHMAINVIYWVITLAIMGGILCAWQP